ncbi:MAG TPA: response regulator [Burkholderiales bacterium]|nr:response regulator [Burkholderiales bacterium]
MERTRVLIVDDNADLRASLKQLLELLGYEVETARDGAAALKAQRERRAAVVITDLFMAGVEGMETIARFKADWPQVRVIAMSGGGEHARGSYLPAALHVGADAILQKPFTVRTLLGALAAKEASDQ